MFSIKAHNPDEGDKILKIVICEAIAKTVIFQHCVTFRAKYEGTNWKHARLCLMLYTPSFGSCLEKYWICCIENWPLWYLWRPLWFWNSFWKMWKFPNVRKGLKNYEAKYDVWMGRRRSQMFQKVEYGLPAKIWRLVGCTKMISW